MVVDGDDAGARRGDTSWAGCGAAVARAVGADTPALVHEGVTVRFANEAAVRALGARAMALVGRAMPSLLARDEGEAGAMLVRRRVLRDDGAALTVAATTRALEGVTGASVTAFEVVAVEAPSRDGEALFHEVFEASPDAILVVDGAGRVARANPAAHALFGYASHELAGACVDALVPDRLRARHAAHRARYATAPAPRRMQGHAPLTARHRDGREIPVEVSIGPVHTADGAATVVLLRDLRARHEAARALAQSEARFRGLFEGATLAMVLCDATGRVVDANPAACALARCARDALCDRALDAVVLRDDDPTRARLVRGGAPSVPVEVTRCALADGATLVIFVDLTERLRAQEALHTASRLDAVGRLAGGIAHDFNSLLTIVLSLSEELDSHFGHDPYAREIVRDLREAGLRAALLTRRLMTFARRQPCRPRVVELNEVVRGFAPLLARTVGERVRLRLDLASSPLAVCIDPVHVEQVLLNLGANARDAMPTGGELRVRTAVDACEGEPVAALEVEDTGTGMSDEVRAHLFEPFFTTKPPGQGTGLGLATIYGLVRQGGGDIRVRSVPGAGTTMQVRLPCVDEAEVRPTP